MLNIFDGKVIAMFPVRHVEGYFYRPSKWGRNMILAIPLVLEA
jgi:hypothetical protein